MGSDGTRELIMATALELFSKKGYAAVSMRDISGAVGIRPSSLYYHFKSKQDIFDAVVQKADALTDELKGMFFKALGNSSEVKCKHFVMAGKAFVTGYLHNDKIGPLFQMLENERFHDIRSNDLWTKEKKRIFSRMMTQLSRSDTHFGPRERKFVKEILEMCEVPFVHK